MADVIKRDTVDYRDPTPFDGSKLQPISEISKAIRHKTYGVDTREALAQQGEALVKIMQETGGNQTAEVAAARGKFELLGMREDAQDNAIKENSSTIDTKVGKSYVDAVLASIAQGGPRELFYSIQALKDKYPTGEDGTYLVLDASFTDGAHAFMWDETAKDWKDLGPYGTNEKTLTKLIDKASAFVEQTQKSTEMEITDMTSAGNDARWTFSYQYADGYVKGAWLNIIGNVDQDYSISFIGVSTNRILYTVTGNGHGKIVVPVNRYINDKFMVSIKCQSFAFTTAEKNGVRFSNQEFDDLKVGTQVNLQWSNDDKPYNLGIEMLYHSVQEDLLLALKKLETTPSANVSSTTNFDSLTQPGGYWIERPQSSAKPEVKNGPNNATWGNYAVYNMQFGNSPQSGSFKMIMQITHTYASETGEGTFVRYLLFNRDGTVNTDNQAIRQWVRLDNVAVEKPKLELDRMFVAGDSITAGHPYEDVTGIHWWESVAKTLNYKVTVGAKNGAGYIYKNGPTNAISIVDSTDFTQYDVAVFAFGTNDYGNNMPLGELGDLYPAKETLYGAVNYVIKTIYSKNPTITLILSTPLNRCDKGVLASKYAYGTPNTEGYTLTQVVEVIKTQADYYGVSYVDNSSSPFNSLSIPSLLVDKLHPTQQGYKLLGAHLASAIGATVRPFIEGVLEDGN